MTFEWNFHTIKISSQNIVEAKFIFLLFVLDILLIVKKILSLMSYRKFLEINFVYYCEMSYYHKIIGKFLILFLFIIALK